MPIKIPADLTIVTLRTGSVVHPQRFTGPLARKLLQQASDLLKERADITFDYASCEIPAPIELPGAANKAVDDAGFHFLVSQFKAGRGVRVIFVDKLARTEIGGRSREEKRVCIVPFDGDVAAIVRRLAHELVHLLGIKDHINEGRTPEPGQEHVALVWRRNLMYSGLLEPAAELNADQVATMRSSALARMFGGS